jgi:hypothetical protein
MPKLRHLANRTKELEVFLKMVSGNHDCRIMLIEGASGMGKTSLLSRFKQKCPLEVKFVPFDCKGVSSIAAFLSEVVVDLGRENFPTFLGKVKLFVQGGVDFSENDIAAKETISIAIISNVDLATQEYRLEQLQQDFIADLEKLDCQIVISLDTYQTASEQLQGWVESKWLRAVSRRLKNVVTVISGQAIPSPNNSVWGDECEHFPLTPILEVDAWCDFCSNWSDHSLSQDSIKTIILLYAGHPAKINQSISLVKEQWSA